MNISIKNGKRSITLTKTERSQMAAVKAVCCELGKQAKGNVARATNAVDEELGVLLAEFRSDAAQSEPEAVAGNDPLPGEEWRESLSNRR